MLKKLFLEMSTYGVGTPFTSALRISPVIPDPRNAIKVASYHESPLMHLYSVHSSLSPRGNGKGRAPSTFSLSL